MKMFFKFIIVVCLLKITVFSSNETETEVVTKKIADMSLSVIEKKKIRTNH